MRSPDLVRVDAMRFTIVARLTSGFPRQFMAMWEKRRCSILFHLLVPGGKWQTVTARPVRLAKRCNSHLHNRSPGPLLPPASAGINREVAARYAGRPITFHQRRRALTAKLAV